MPEAPGVDKVGVAAILALRTREGRGCGTVSGALQAAAALLWAVRLLNGDLPGQTRVSFIPGVRLGESLH